jgi:hypothetical protein
MRPRTPQDAIGSLVLVGLLLFGAAGVLACFAIAASVGAGIASAGFAIAGAVVILSAVLLYRAYLDAGLLPRPKDDVSAVTRSAT